MHKYIPTRHILFIVVLANIFVIPVVMAATPKTTPTKIQITKPIYAWQTESENDKSTGHFDHCLVKNMYDNGTLMVLAQNNAGIKRLALNFPQNKMVAGQHFDLAIQIDKRDVFPVEAIAVSPQTLAIGIPEALPDQMRKGQILYLRGPNDEVQFNLNGMDGAVMALQDCIIAQKSLTHSPVVASNNVEAAAVPIPEDKQAAATDVAAQEKPIKATKPVKTAATSKTVKVTASPLPSVPTIAPAKPAQPVTAAVKNPIPDKIIAPAPVAPIAVSTPAPTSPAPKIDTIPDNKVIEVAGDSALPQSWKNVFNKTPYGPEHLIPLKNRTPNQPLDYIWKSDQVFIGVKGKAVAPGESLNALSTDYLKMLHGRCKGNFVAQSSPTQQSGKNAITWQESEVACSSSKNGDSIAALIFAFTPQGGQIYFFESKSNQGAEAIKARDTILKKVLN